MAEEGAISLYFGLKEGERADLEVIAEATLQWVAALKAAASAIDPDATVTIEIVNAEEGSLRINTILGWVEKQLARVEAGTRAYPNLRSVAVTLAFFLLVDAPDMYERWFGEPAVIELSEEDRKLLREFIDRTRTLPEVETRRKKFFRILERDPSISSAGAAEGPTAQPMIIVPSNRFAEMSGLWVPEEERQERTIYPIVDVTLLSPVLVGRPASWRFQPIDGLPAFNARMKDKRFLAALEESHVQERLRTGIRMTIRLEIKERNVSGAWVVKRRGRSVVEVISPKTN